VRNCAPFRKQFPVLEVNYDIENIKDPSSIRKINTEEMNLLGKRESANASLMLCPKLEDISLPV
jgi:hypothetical protein